MKEKTKEKMSLLRQAGREGVQDGAALGVTAAARVASLSREVKATVTLTLASLVFFLGSSNVALAAACGGKPTDKITNFMSSAATFMIAIGGVGALLMFAVGAALIIFAVRPQYNQMGMTFIKNALIGLAILVSGVFIKEVLLSFIAGATGGQGEEKCAENNLNTGGR